MKLNFVIAIRMVPYMRVHSLVIEYKVYTLFFLFILENFSNCLVGLVVLSATATLEVLGSIPESSKKVLLSFSMKFSVAARSELNWVNLKGT